MNKLEQEVRTEILPLLREYTADALPEPLLDVVRELRSRWLDDKIFESLAREFVRASDRTLRSRFERSVGVDAFDNTIVSDFLAAAVRENIKLIKGMVSNSLDDVAVQIESNIRAGKRSKDVIADIEKRLKVSRSRAKLIARDQTNKLAGGLARTRQQGAGFSHFKWVTSKDIAVRDRHTEISKQDAGFGPGVYAWSDLPRSDKGEPIYPGSEIQCRCIAAPVRVGG